MAVPAPKLSSCWGIAVAAILLCAIGCYRTATDGEQTTYRFAYWLGPVVLVGSCAAFVVGRRWRELSEYWRFLFVFMSPVLVLIVAPMLFLDRAVVDSTGFETRVGFWFAPTRHRVDFDDLLRIHYHSKTDDEGFEKGTFYCATKGGGGVVVPVGDLAKFAVPEILERAAARGVHVRRSAG